MQVCQGGLAVHQHSTPNKRADTTQDDTELVDAEQWSSGSHALRVAQRSVPLKGSPRYLALSMTGASSPPGRPPTSPSSTRTPLVPSHVSPSMSSRAGRCT